MARNRVQVSLPDDVLEALDRLCKVRGLNRSALVSYLIVQAWREEQRTVDDFMV